MLSPNEIRTQVTNEIIEALTKGNLPPWRKAVAIDRNAGFHADTIQPPASQQEDRRARCQLRPLPVAFPSNFCPPASAERRQGRQPSPFASLAASNPPFEANQPRKHLYLQGHRKGENR